MLAAGIESEGEQEVLNRMDSVLDLGLARRVAQVVLGHRNQPRAVAAMRASSLRAAALSVASQVKVSSVRPKWPNAAVAR